MDEKQISRQKLLKEIETLHLEGDASDPPGMALRMLHQQIINGDLDA